MSRSAKLDEMLWAANREHASLAVLMIELDRFKCVNDTLGHDVGDELLVEDCAADPHDAALCRAAIALGLALGLEVVAEGVETQDQRQFLAQEHCSTIQGYLIAAPMRAEETFAFVSSSFELPRLRRTAEQRGENDCLGLVARTNTRSA